MHSSLSDKEPRARDLAPRPQDGGVYHCPKVAALLDRMHMSTPFQFQKATLRSDWLAGVLGELVRNATEPIAVLVSSHISQALIAPVATF